MVENEILENEKTINELIDSYNQISETYETQIEKRAVYEKISNLISDSNNNDITNEGYFIYLHLKTQKIDVRRWNAV